MKKLFFLQILLLLVFPSLSKADEEAAELIKKGYTQTSDYCCISFDGCDYDKLYKLGSYIFECNDYSYSYTFGDVYILSNGYSSYLCTDDGTCYEGTLRR